MDEGGTPERATTERPAVTTDVADRSSGRIGDAVFYDPDGDGGPYADGQEALADVPVGGTFVIGHGTWDVAEEGRLLIEKTVQVRGMGWGSTREDDRGTRIVNTGDDTIDDPAIEFRGPEEPAEQNPRILGSLRDVHVVHEGDAPAVLFQRSIRTVVADCNINCRGKAPVGLKYETWGFFARALRNKVSGATNVCTQVTGVGYAHEFYSNHCATSTDGATAFQTECNRTIVIGGEYASTGEGGIAIRFKGRLRGGYVATPGIEATDVGIDLGTHGVDGLESGPVEDVQLYHIGMGGGGGDVGVRFGNARGCRLVRPVPFPWGRPADGGDFQIAEWSEASRDCGMIASAWALADEQYRDEGGTNPYVHVNSGVDDDVLARLPAGVPTTVGYSQSAGAPAVHDGSGWERVVTEPFSLGDE
jgi:hypothetical protein